MSKLAGFHAQRGTINNTFRTRFGQAKSLIKQHDTVGVRQLAAISTWQACKIHPVMPNDSRSATRRAHQHHTANSLATHKELSEFFVATERRAYKQALFAVRDEQVALEMVQEAMTKLVEKYAARPSAELPLLFQRILQNTIRDYFRRRKVRALWTTQISSLISNQDADYDPLETLEPDIDAPTEATPDNLLQQSQILEIIEQALQQLPLRQRQAFLLRYWEEMDVAETAKAMGCSEGSVKTHCSRATHALAAMLREKGITL